MRFSDRHIDNLCLRLFHQAPGTTYDQLDVAAATALPSVFAANWAANWAASLNETRFVKHPLNSPVEQDGMIEFGDLAIEPEMNTGDRRGRKMPQSCS